VLVDMVAVGVMQVAAMQVVDVSFVEDGRMAASGSVLVIVCGVGLVVFHALNVPPAFGRVNKMRLRRSLTTAGPVGDQPFSGH
jgi:hypothetical protein